MKKLLLALLPLVLTASCGTALVLAGVGVAIGMWVADDFSEAEGEIHLKAPPEEVFQALVSEARTRPEAVNVEVREGAMRVEWDEGNIHVIGWVLLWPEAPEISTLKVTAYELGVKGRIEVAKEIGEAVASRF